MNGRGDIGGSARSGTARGGIAGGDAARVTVVSPHFDDVPLSLGQSLRDGALSHCRVRVRVAFGSTNWTTWIHPTRSRAGAVSLWRRLEETAAARTFGYRFTAARWEEALLRWDTLDTERLLDVSSDLSAEPLVGDVRGWLDSVLDPVGPAPDLLLVPAGLGGHVDHRIVALAAADLVDRSGIPIGFYEDRPYVAYLDEAQVAEQLAPLGLDLGAVRVSPPVQRSTQMRARRCYPSQMDPFFEDAMDLDRERGAGEQVWFPAGVAPDWFT